MRKRVIDHQESAVAKFEQFARSRHGEGPAVGKRLTHIAGGSELTPETENVQSEYVTQYW
jgi:hypothetical protein